MKWNCGSFLWQPDNQGYAYNAYSGGKVVRINFCLVVEIFRSWRYQKTTKEIDVFMFSKN